MWWSPGSYNYNAWGLYRNADYCDWDIKFNGDPYGTSTHQVCSNGLSYAYEVAVGLEISERPRSHSPKYYSDTVSDENLRTWHDGAWHPWEYQVPLNTEPCKGLVVSHCFDGTNDSNNSIWRVDRRW